MINDACDPAERQPGRHFAAQQAAFLNGARVAILGGCGHVGLPLGMVLARRGCQVDLVDISAERIARVNAGSMPFHEDGADVLLPQVVQAGRLRATADRAVIERAAAVIITIGTPVGEHLDPRLGEFDRAIASILPSLRAGQLMVVRSTVFPGVTERLGRQLDEAGRGDVDLAYCPERIRQGRSLVELRELAQIVGGTTARAAARAAALFQLISPQVVFLTPLEAELAKLFCNAYLYINYALANQLYMLARQHDVDYQRVLEGLRAGFPRLHGLARAGFAAGPCLVKDTIQLGGFNPGSFPLGQVAMAINEGLPAVLVEELKRAYPLAEMTVGILGMAFKPNCDDPRDSLAYKLRKVLSLCGSRVLCTDPYVPDPDLVPLEVVLESSDLIVVGAAHDCYRDLEFRQPVFDVSGTIRPRATMSAAAPATDMVRGGERT